MHDRKFKMYQESDAFIAMPGGFGTLDELMEIMYVTKFVTNMVYSSVIYD